MARAYKKNLFLFLLLLYLKIKKHETACNKRTLKTKPKQVTNKIKTHKNMQTTLFKMRLSTHIIVNINIHN